MNARAATQRIKVLAFVRCYLPGFRLGGPVRTIANMVEQLSPAVAFRIVTADRDALAADPYPDVAIDAWNAVGKAEVLYASPRTRGIRAMGRILRDTPHDVLYLNSFFDPVFTLRPYLAMRLGLAPARPCVIAPRGEFSEGALRLKAWKKWSYIELVRRTGWFRGAIWQASSRYEVADIRQALRPVGARIEVATNLAPLLTEPAKLPPHEPRRPDEPLRVCFLSRIVPKKNLDFALRVVARVSVPVRFDIYGPVGDERYWRRCRARMASMPQHINVRYHGEVPHARVRAVMAAHDLFLLPTLGENFGHVIAEALAAGTPVLISDTTPWRGLAQAGVGWDLSLNEESTFVRCLEHCSYTEPWAYDEWCAKVRTYARAVLDDNTDVEANRRLFRLAAGLLQERTRALRSG